MLSFLPPLRAMGGGGGGCPWRRTAGANFHVPSEPFDAVGSGWALRFGFLASSLELLLPTPRSSFDSWFSGA